MLLFLFSERKTVITDCLFFVQRKENRIWQTQKQKSRKCRVTPDEGDYDPFFNGEEDFFMEDLKDGLEVQPIKEPEGSPSWWVKVEYTNHTEQDICSYEDYLSDRPEELYLSLLEYFEPEDEVF